MSDPQDDPDLNSPDTEVFEAALKRLGDRLRAKRADIDAPEQAEQVELSPDLQQALRDSGARRIDEHTYATNQGTVILMSPADMKRMALSDRLQGSIDRTRRWSEPGYIGGGVHAIPGRGK